jgi:hypothetical protein
MRIAVICRDYLLILLLDEWNWNEEQSFENPARKTPLPLFPS